MTTSVIRRTFTPTAISSSAQASTLKPSEAIIKIKGLSGYKKQFGDKILFRSEIESAYQNCRRDQLKFDEFIQAMNIIFDDSILNGLDRNPKGRLEAILWGAHRLSNAHGIKSGTTKDVTHSSLRAAYAQFFEDLHSVFSVDRRLNMQTGRLSTYHAYSLNYRVLGRIIGAAKMSEVQNSLRNLHSLVAAKNILEEHIKLDALRESFLNPKQEPVPANGRTGDSAANLFFAREIKEPNATPPVKSKQRTLFEFSD